MTPVIQHSNLNEKQLTIKAKVVGSRQYKSYRIVTFYYEEKRDGWLNPVGTDITVTDSDKLFTEGDEVTIEIKKEEF